MEYDSMTLGDQYSELDNHTPENYFKNLFSCDTLSFDLNQSDMESGQVEAQVPQKEQHVVEESDMFIQEHPEQYEPPAVSNQPLILPRPTESLPPTHPTSSSSKKASAKKQNVKSTTPKETVSKKRKSSKEMNRVLSKVKKTNNLFGVDLARVNQNNYYYRMHKMIQENNDDIMTNTCKMLIVSLAKDIIENAEKQNINFMQHMYKIKTKEQLDDMISVIDRQAVPTLENLEVDAKTRAKIESFLYGFLESIQTEEHVKMMNFVKKQGSVTKRIVLYYYWLLHFVPKKFKSIVEDRLGMVLNEFYIETCHVNTCN